MPLSELINRGITRRRVLAGLAGIPASSLIGRTAMAMTGGEAEAVAGPSSGLRQPWGLAVLDGEAFAADCEAKCVWRLGRDGSVSTVAPRLQLDRPMDVAVASDGRILVLDAGQGRIWAINLGNFDVEHVAGNGRPGFSGDGAAARDASFSNPIALAAAPDGTTFVADHDNLRIRQIDPAGVITTVAGTGILDDAPGGDGAGTSTNIGPPAAIAISSSGQVYFSDLRHTRIRGLDADGFCTTVAGDAPLVERNVGGRAGVADQDALSNGDGGPARRASVGHIYGLAFSTREWIYLSDTKHFRIRRLRDGGSVEGVVGSNPQQHNDGSSTLTGPLGLAVSNDELWFTDRGGYVRRIHSPEL